MKLLGSRDLEPLVRNAVLADSTTEGPIQVHEEAFATCCEQIRTCDAMAEDYERWTDADTSDLVQVLITTLVSVSQHPVLNPGDNLGFAIAASAELANRNGRVLDTDGCEFFLRLLLNEPQPTLDGGLLADLRALVCDHLYVKRDDLVDGTVRLSGRGPVRNPGRTAFIAPPLTGVSGVALSQIMLYCAAIEELLLSFGFDEVLQPVHYCNPDRFPTASLDSDLVRRIDIDNILRSDLVVVLLVQPATGLGTVLAWAERGGVPQLLITDGEAVDSPLPRSSTGRVEQCPLKTDEFLRDATRCLELQRDAIDAHLEQRLARPDVQGGDFKRFRDAFMRAGRSRVAAELPAWFTAGRALELLRTIDHFAAASDEEYRTLQHALGLDVAELVASAGLSLDDLGEAARFAETIGLTRMEFAELLQAAAREIEAAGLGVAHRRRTHDWWFDLYAGIA